MKAGEAAVDRLLEVNDREPVVVEARGALALADSAVKGHVRFEAVRFRYGERVAGEGCVQWALDGVSLEVKAGETVALVGPSGGGKTTLLSLLLRLHDPNQGEKTAPCTCASVGSVEGR